MSNHSLPPIRTMVPYCETCGSAFQSPVELSQHLCNTTANRSLRESAFRPFTQTASLDNHPQFRYAPEPSPTESSNSRASCSPTLTSGFFPLATPPAEGSVSDNQRRTGQRKCQKEQLQRDSHGKYLQDLEDIFEFMCGIDMKKGTKGQSRGNETLCGLTVSKDEIYQITVTVLLHLISPRYAHAVEQGNEEHFKADMRGVVDHLRRSGGYPSQGTVFDDGDIPPCRRNKAKKLSRQCTTHHHADWIECRKERKKLLLKHNVSKLLENGRPANPRTNRL